jgi:hypothetical protein
VQTQGVRPWPEKPSQNTLRETDDARTNTAEKKGIRVRRDNWVSVRYAEELNSGESSVTLQWTDRHEIWGEKSTDFPVSW